MRTYLAWDLETGLPKGMNITDYETLRVVRAEEDPPQWHDPFELWPFPITVAAYKISTSSAPGSMCYERPEGLDEHAASNFLTTLSYYAHLGFTLVGWNTTRFDWPVLGRTTGRWADCKRLCLKSIDIPFQVHRTEGHLIGQDAACKGLGLPGKPRHDMGAVAPVLWAQGEYRQVREYGENDTDQLALIYAYGCANRHIRWRTRDDNLRAYPLPYGWLTVEQCLSLPAPDQSWQDNPLPIDNGLEWVLGNV